MKPIGVVVLISIILLPFLLVSQSLFFQDTLQIIELNQKAWKERNIDLEFSKKLANEALRLSKKNHYRSGEAVSDNIIGTYHKAKSQYDSAGYYFRESLALRRNAHDTIGMAISMRNIMGIEKLQGRYDIAVSTGTNALELLAKMSGSERTLKERAWIKAHLAPIYLKLGDYRAAIQNCLDAKVTFKKFEDNAGLASAIMNLGNVYEETKEYSKALSQFLEAIELNTKIDNQKELAKAYTNVGNIYYDMDKYDEALLNYLRGLKIRQDQGFVDGMSISYLNIGIIYKSVDRMDSALKYYHKSLNLCEESGNIEGQYKAYRELGDLFKSKKRYEESIQFLKKALVMTTQSRGTTETLTLYQELEESYDGLGRHDSALIYSRKYVALSDSLNEALRSSIVFESTIKDKEYQLAISKEKNRSQTYVIIGLTSFILLLCIILFLVFKSQRAKKKMLHLQELIKEQELMALDAMIEGQETERKRLAGELHDTIGSILSAIKFAFKAVENMVVPASYKKINHMLDEALRTVRQISHDLASGVVLENGIDDALKQLCATLQDTGKIQIKLDIFGFNERAETAVELNIYRIIQELLTNILKHSQAEQVSIQLLKSQDNINLMVTDDGKGFNPAGVQTKYGIGLSNIDKRVQNMSGRWNIDSGKGNGTTVVIDVPLNDSNT